MKKKIQNIAFVVVMLFVATVASAAGNVSIVKTLNGVANEAVNDLTVTSSVSGSVCTITVPAVDAYYVNQVTYVKLIDAGSAQSRKKEPGDTSDGPGVDQSDEAAKKSDTTWEFTMPSGEYDVEVTVDFFGKTDISAATVVLETTAYVYNPEVTPEPAVQSVDLDGTTITAENYDVSYSNNDKVGTATVTVTGKGTYMGTATATFTISQAAITPTVDLEGWVYGNTPNNPSLTGNSGNGDVTYTYSVDGADEYTNKVPENAGDYIVKATIAATDNYQGAEVTDTFKISKANLQLAIDIVDFSGWTYGDDPVDFRSHVTGNLGNGEVTIKYQGDNDEVPTTTVPTNAGGYTVFASVAETANYNAGETTREFSIEKADFTQVTIEAIADQTYTGDAIEPEITVMFKGNVVAASEYIPTYSDNKNVGQATVTLASQNENFFLAEGAVAPTANFQIVQAQATITLNAETKTYTYNGQEQEFDDFTVTNGSVVVRYYGSEADRTQNENLITSIVDAGTYYVKLEQGDANYTSDPVNATFTIDPKTLTDDMVWIEGGEFVYDGQPKTLEEEGMYGADDSEIGELNENVDFEVSYDNNINVGTATITFTGKGNYEGTVIKTFSILRELNISFSDANSWASYYAEEDLEIPEGLKAYIVTEVGASDVTVEEISYIPQHVAVLLTYEEQAYADGEFLAAAYDGTTQEFDNNLLLGTSAPTNVEAIGGGSVYVLYNNEFVKSVSGTIPAYRGYLVLETANSRSLGIVIDENATGIATVGTAAAKANGLYYNLQGQRMAQPKKGLVIVDGKKVVIK